MKPLPSIPAIRRATVADAATLTALGRRTYSDTFAADNTPEDVAQFLDSAYSTELQTRELADPALTYLVVESDNGMIAFALIRKGKANPCVDDPGAIEVQRFYVDRSSHGTGVAQQLMTACVDFAESCGAETLFLGVWERNARALRFYEKHGFRAVGAQIFRVGSDDQTDIVMARSIVRRG